MMSRYWFNRMILGMGATAAYGVPVAQRRACHNASQRKYYRKLLAKGLTPRQAKGINPERHRAWQRAYEAKWGGRLGLGTQAWINREIARGVSIQ